MLLLSEREIESIFTMEACIGLIEQAYTELARGSAVNQPRASLLSRTSRADAAAALRVPESELAERLPPAMAGPDTPMVYAFKTTVGIVPSAGVGVVRINSEVMGYAVGDGKKVRSNLPVANGFRYCGALFCFSTVNGDPLGIIPDGPVSNLIAGAKGAVCTQYLSRPDASTLGVIGAGEQATQSVFAAAAVRRIGRVLVYSLDGQERFARAVQERTGIPVTVLDDPQPVVQQAEILITATTSTRPVLKGEWLAPGTHLLVINPSDVGDDCFERADLVVRTYREDGEYLQEHVVPSDAEAIGHEKRAAKSSRRETISLGDVLLGQHPGRTSPEQITLHDNVSAGMQFAPLCAHILRVAQERGLGRTIPNEYFLHNYH